MLARESAVPVPVMIRDFVDLVVDDLGRAPRWWKRMLAEIARDILRERRERKHRARSLVDAPAPYAEILKLRRAA